MNWLDPLEWLEWLESILQGVATPPCKIALSVEPTPSRRAGASAGPHDGQCRYRVHGTEHARHDGGPLERYLQQPRDGRAGEPAFARERQRHGQRQHRPDRLHTASRILWNRDLRIHDQRHDRHVVHVRYRHGRGRLDVAGGERLDHGARRHDGHDGGYEQRHHPGKRYLFRWRSLQLLARHRRPVGDERRLHRPERLVGKYRSPLASARSITRSPIPTAICPSRRTP